MDNVSRAIVREVVQGLLAIILLVGGGLLIHCNPDYRDLLPAFTGLAGGVIGYYYTRNGLKPIDYVRPKDASKSNQGS